MSVKPPRKRTVFTALALVFAIAWTYAHIAYAWPWKELSNYAATCSGQYYLSGSINTRSEKLGTLSNGRIVYVGIRGKVSMGREIGSFSVSSIDDNKQYEPLAYVPEVSLGDSATVEGVGTFTLKRAYSGTVWFTPNPGGATFCFDPDPTFTMLKRAKRLK